ncbi:MAG: toll/interleukin-1 receptor domain-containing protein [Bdellovibrionales bacterium]
MIFISHRYADEQKARELSSLLKSKDVESYLDVLDPATRATVDITKHIMKNLDGCSHLIVIFSVNTNGSLWVPFELGAAYKGEKGIGTLLVDNVATPQYLDTFPKMKTSADIDQYLEEYRADRKLTKSYSSIRMNESDGNAANSFIRRVKGRLRQY